jgi:DNA-binding beta-propeller fold protein YncE
MKPRFASVLFILFGLSATHAAAAGPPSEGTGALLYAVGESANLRGLISVYDIAAEHRLIKTIHTVPGVGDVRGVAASAVTGKLYVAYIDVSGTGMVFCLNIYDDTILWNKPISPGVDRLAINPDGQLL